MVVPSEPLAQRTTFHVGGPAEMWCEVSTSNALMDAVRHSAESGAAITVMGGGSNVLVADDGVCGLVLGLGHRGIDVEEHEGHLEIRADAGASWDELVSAAVSRRGSGLECLSGIPGQVGAAPIQNIGAYGQQVSDVLVDVLAFHLGEHRWQRFSQAECGLGYRHSRFREDPQWLIWEAKFRIPLGESTPRYPDLVQRLGPEPTAVDRIRACVLEVRASKSMLVDPADPNHRSAGSFFINPVVSSEVANDLRSRFPDLKSHAHHDGAEKLAAAWLIERAGFPKGTCEGEVGQSTKHALALINRGHATCLDVIAFASKIRSSVARTFGLKLSVEPRFLGFPQVGTHGDQILDAFDIDRLC